MGAEGWRGRGGCGSGRVEFKESTSKVGLGVQPSEPRPVPRPDRGGAREQKAQVRNENRVSPEMWTQN